MRPAGGSRTPPVTRYRIRYRSLIGFGVAVLGGPRSRKLVFQGRAVNLLDGRQRNRCDELDRIGYGPLGPPAIQVRPDLLRSNAGAGVDRVAAAL